MVLSNAEDTFTYAVPAAGLATATGDITARWFDRAVEAISYNGGTHRATATITGHGFANGDTVRIFNVQQPEYNGEFVISGATANTFEYVVPGAPGPPTQPTATAPIVATRVAKAARKYTGSVNVSATTVVRAVAAIPGELPSNDVGQTYIFLSDVLNQPASPAGYPTFWGPTGNGVSADYAMDTRVTTADQYKNQIKDALKSLPTVSIVTDRAYMFDPVKGIYTNPLSSIAGATTANSPLNFQQPVSFEYFTSDGSVSGQLNASLRLYGGWGRGPGYRKHSFRLVFKEPYGPTKLDLPLFDDGAVNEFDTLILRANFNDGWTGGNNAQYIRELFTNETMLAIGGAASHGNFVHLYVDGLYWGLYNPVERPDASFAAKYLGNDKTEWDAYNVDVPINDSSTQPRADFMTDSLYASGSQIGYQRVQGNLPDGSKDPATEAMLDVDNYIAYMLTEFYIGNGDWPGHNYYMARPRGPDSTGFKFFTWDSEAGTGLWQSSPTYDGIAAIINNSGAAPTKPFYWFQNNADFQMRFADEAYRQLFNDGALTVAAATARYKALADEIDAAMIGESARWGDIGGSGLKTQVTWRTQRDYVLNTWIAQRSGAPEEAPGAGLFLQQLINHGLYPRLPTGARFDPPTFVAGGKLTYGGTVNAGDALTMNAVQGNIYYRVDGADPAPRPFPDR